MRGAISWLVIMGVVLFVMAAFCSSSPLFSTAADNAAAQRYKAAAEASRADAERIQAEAYAEAMSKYTDAGVAAIQADRVEAHPMQAIAGVVGQAVMYAVGLVVALGLASVAAVSARPELIITILDRVQDEREPVVVKPKLEI